MSHPLEKLLTTYLTQQEESGIPVYLLGEHHEPVKPIPLKLSLPGIPAQPEPPVRKEYKPVVQNREPVPSPTSGETVSPVQVTPPTPATVSTQTAPQTPPVQAVRTHEMIRSELADLYRRGRECSACAELSHNRTKVVFGAGNASAKIMIIGEAPGYEEDQQGVPFVGATGQLLNKMLAAINVDRDTETFVSNVIKCRPPGNRTPSTQECLTCLPILKRQIAIIRPSIILILGKTAANAVLNNPSPINQIHGKEFDYYGIPAIVTYHPAALLRDSSLKRPAWEDLQTFQKRYRELTNG